MATHTLGTNANNSLVAVKFSYDTTVLLPADLATINANIKNDINPAHPSIPGAFVREGFLVIPNRQACILLLPGDGIAVDSTGWPIVLSARSLAAGPWTFT